ncbi:MAG: transporter [Chitinivibrionia bacterium]|nr:transporter [Chitinivibrionia bacterium]
MNSNRIRFDRNELAGSFGDIGTDLPLIVGIILAAGLDGASVFFMFGLLQITMGFVYGLPMPMQPLKAMAVLVITQKIAGNILFGAGLAIGLVMLILSLSGGLGLLARWIPRCVVRGIQFGLGLSLASLALKNYIPSMGGSGYGLAVAALLAMLVLWGNRRVPPGLLVVAIGAAYAVATGLNLDAIAEGVGITLPSFRVPDLSDIATGFVVLALPQIPLSISNSVIATDQTIRDLFPDRRVGVRKIGLTYSFVNLLVPFFGGVPACHGCGGLAGHYTFGARTGGSVIIYGAFYLVLGLFLSGPLHEVLKVFPQPILGVILLFEALKLLTFVRDQADSLRDISIALLVGVVAMAVKQGFVVGLLLGCLVYYGFKRFGRGADETDSSPVV